MILVRRKNGRKNQATMKIAIGKVKPGRMRNQAVLKASAGKARNVTELIDVPTRLRPITQPEKLLPPTKYSSVFVFLREK
jgi:hypothetical protein